MGFFGKLAAFSAGPLQAITCKTCGTNYRGNIDKRFPYAICGSCLESAQEDAERNGDQNMYSTITAEFNRREDLHL